MNANSPKSRGRAIALVCVLVAAFLASMPAARAAAVHGGVYRGPGATLGPGGTGPRGPKTAPRPKPRVPVTKRPSLTAAGVAAVDLSAWSRWWSLNRDRYLGLRAAVHGGASVTGDDSFYLGQGSEPSASGSLRPSPLVISQQVVPALLKALEERDIDTLTGALLALAKIGQEAAGPEHDLAAAIATFLKHPTQEVHETAAIALGVLANSDTAPLLADLLHDTEAGRKLVGNGRVSLRARTFAAYGLGLIGNRATSESSRSYAVHHLSSMLLDSSGERVDLGVAAVLSLGLIPLASGAMPSPKEPNIRPGASLQSEVVFLLQLLDDSGPRGIDERVRAQIPVALARLTEHGDPLLKGLVSQRLVRVLEKHSREHDSVQQGAVHALGLLGDSDQDADDVAIRRVLLTTAKWGDRIARNLALVAMARGASRIGSGEVGGGPAKVRAYLLKTLSQGTSSSRPWAAVALGLFEHGNARNGQESSAPVRLALRMRFRDKSSPSEAGALAIALGLCGERASSEDLIGRLGKGEDSLRMHLATGLGLMRASDAIPRLREIVRDSRHRPPVMRESAIALAMLGDKATITAMLQRLKESTRLLEQVALAAALGHIGDMRSVEPLIAVLENERLSDTTRAFAGVALGVICDKEPYPWNAKIAADVSWWQTPATLLDPSSGKGILDLF